MHGTQNCGPCAAQGLGVLKKTVASAGTRCARSSVCHALGGAGRGAVATLSRTIFRLGRRASASESAGIAVGVFEVLVRDLQAVLRLAAEAAPQPTAAVLDARTLQSSCQEGAKRTCSFEPGPWTKAP
jgi:hypothetical protein